MNHRELIERTRTTESALSFAFEYGYLNSIYICPTCELCCNLQKFKKSIDDKCFRCITCKSRYSVRINNFLYESKLHLTIFFDLIYYFFKGNYCLAELSLEVSLNRNTITKFYKLMKQAILEFLINHPEKVGGPA